MQREVHDGIVILVRLYAKRLVSGNVVLIDAAHPEHLAKRIPGFVWNIERDFAKNFREKFLFTRDPFFGNFVSSNARIGRECDDGANGCLCERPWSSNKTRLLLSGIVVVFLFLFLLLSTFAEEVPKLCASSAACVQPTISHRIARLFLKARFHRPLGTKSTEQP